jgi:hypothetical protein
MYQQNGGGARCRGRRPGAWNRVFNLGLTQAARRLSESDGSY